MELRQTQSVGTSGFCLTPDCCYISQADGHIKFIFQCKNSTQYFLDTIWRYRAPFYYTIFKIIGKQTLYNDGILESIYIRGELNIGATRPILILSDGLT